MSIVKTVETLLTIELSAETAAAAMAEKASPFIPTGTILLNSHG